MPELPEVETIARQLAPVLQGRRVHGLALLDSRLAPIQTRAVVGARVGAVQRLGKQVVLRLDPTPTGAAPRRAPRSPTELPAAAARWLVVHLRMTGRLLWQPGAQPAPLAHTRARLRLEGGTLVFVDPRRFGTLSLVDDLECVRPRGLEPLGAEHSVDRLAALLAAGGARQAIKPWLLRQDRLVGLGNIYAAEALFAARIDPRRAVGRFRPAEVARLHAAIGEVLTAAIAHCGTTFSDFQDAHGVTGSYQHYLRVYRREGLPCLRCAGTVRRLVQQQRSTFYCARCQRGAG
ncbi:MAG: bifunctional DNA-formamidopyrimidine glycosylase/DNA-(apurinic or apyrimidinic site) lyase [Proteobacteria bacterium]|nr:bifunctional DNA-formamidopyrimidine glycosylase/DNA-(apurinic or apyrimidinic site) lyase [Pseudomonadota bacterium]